MVRNNSVKKVDRLASFKDLLGDQKVFNRKKSRELLGTKYENPSPCTG
jgi:hypothetical protein